MLPSMYPEAAWVTPSPVPVTQSDTRGAVCTRKLLLLKSNTRRRVDCLAKAARRREADIDASVLEEQVLKATNDLRQECKWRVEKYVAAKDLFQRAVGAAVALEGSRAGFSSSSRLQSLIPGKWTLLFTDSNAVIKNAGSITGLGSLPGAKCTRVDVILERGGRARTVESVTVFGLLNGENTLIGKWKLAGKGENTLEVTYASAILMGRTTLRADSKAVLNTTYCGNRVRIGRSASGDLFVFERVRKLIPTETPTSE